MTIADMAFIPDILTRLEGMAEDEGWDRPAHLYGLYAEHVIDDVTAVGVGEFPGFDLAMELRGHSYHALTAIRGALHRVPSGDPRRPDLSGLFALVLVDECFSVKAEPGQPRPAGPFSEHPDRIEQRFVLLVAHDQSTKTLVRTRSGTPSRHGPAVGGTAGSPTP